jgi:hypothetical protein
MSMDQLKKYGILVFILAKVIIVSQCLFHLIINVSSRIEPGYIFFPSQKKKFVYLVSRTVIVWKENF